MFGSDETTLYEGVWEIDGVDPLNEDEVIVSFTTAYYKSEDEAKDPTERQPYDYGPNGDKPQSVRLNAEDVPSVDDFNTDRNALYNHLTEILDFDVKTE